jgi:hypothetical protein
MHKVLLACLLLVVAAPAAPLAADNLLQNPGFANGLTGWTVESYSSGTWDSFNHSGGMSGSVLLASNLIPGNAPNASIGQCVPVQAGHSYAFGGSVFVPSGVAPGAVVSEYLDARFYTGPGCSGTMTDQIVRIVAPPLRDTWGDVQGNAAAPVGSVSARLYLGGVAYEDDAATESIQIYVDDGYFFSDQTCAETESHLCLAGNRFRVWGAWAVPTQDREGYMRSVGITPDSGLFWFFAPNNLEVFVKVLNACSDPYNHYWVFASGLTNVQTSLNVEDTVQGGTNNYYNPQGTPFPPIQDTSAFATCP